MELAPITVAVAATDLTIVSVALVVAARRRREQAATHDHDPPDAPRPTGPRTS